MFVTPVPAIIDIGPTKIIQYGRQIQDGHHTIAQILVFINIKHLIVHITV
jgi:hypothetical protein